MSEEKPLVSILCPCYNSEKYIFRMLDSVLKQTYPNIELICIDDGSEDHTSEIINSYTSIFNVAGKALVYMRREHRGQAAAVNAGLKEIKGDYFALLDSDDFLLEESIDKRVAALEEHRDYSVVVSDYFIVNEDDLNTITGRGNDYIGNLCYQPYQFYLTLAGYSSIASLGYMVRTEAMRNINPLMEINECKEGQNYQILLPLYYHYKRYYIDEALAYYVLRNNSHDHMQRTREQVKERYMSLLQMLKEVFIEMRLSPIEIEKCLKMSTFNYFLEVI